MTGTLLAYWWSPARTARSLLGETVRHGRAWAHLLRHGGGPSNFGDAVGPLVLAELTGRPVGWAPLGRADVVCVGSVLNAYVRDGSTAMVLGAGVRTPDGLEVPAGLAARVLAVRGTGTRDVLGLPGGTPLGDPGLLVRGMVAPEHGPRRPPLLVPHFAAAGTAAGRRLLGAARAAGFDVLLPNAHPLEVAAAVRRAAWVATSSLHAAVFADALEVPVQLVDLAAGRASEPGFKYDDYTSAVGAPLRAVPAGDVLRAGAASGPPEGSLRRLAVVRPHLDEVVQGLHRAAAPLAR